MRCGLLALVLVILAGGCADDSTIAESSTTTTTFTSTTGVAVPVTPIDADELATVAGRLEGVVRAHVAAWNGQNVPAILALYDAETIHDDSLFGVVLQGEELYSMPEGFIQGFSEYRSAVTRVWVARDVALVADSGWGMTLRGIPFTEEAPMLEVDRIEVQADGTIGRWSLWYDLDMWEAWGAPGFRMEAARAVLDGRDSAWTTADPDLFEAIYAADAERSDVLVGTSATGPLAIAAIAADLAAAGVVIGPIRAFSDSRSAAADTEVVGSVQSLTTADGCIVETAVVLTVTDGLIVHEEVFWDPASLTRCGWAA